jgi:hypothetical protein
MRSSRAMRPSAYIIAKYEVIHRPDSYFFQPGDPPFYLEQRMLFCDYGRNPAHEPGAVLDAARLFPLTSFHTENPKVLRVRVDYRMNMGLDVFLKPEAYAEQALVNRWDDIRGIERIPRALSLEQALAQTLERQPTKEEIELIKARPNQAGIFRDEEEIGYVYSGLTKLSNSKEVIKTIFYAGEKPVPWEVYAFGLVNGLPGEFIGKGEKPKPRSSFNRFSPFTKGNTTWDNIHIWGGFLWGTSGNRLPSSPGAFHALHFHWRWGFVSGFPGPFDKLFIPLIQDKLGAFGNEQFQGIGNYPGWRIGGGLIDPKLSNQTIRFVIIDSQTRLTEEKVSDGNYFDLFGETPQSIFQGVDMIVGTSFEVYKEESSKIFNGSLLIAGLYFAHNAEPQEKTPLATDTQGVPLAQYKGGDVKFDSPLSIPKSFYRDADGLFLE